MELIYMLNVMKTLSSMAQLDDVSCMDVVRCIYNLSQTDTKTFNSMPESTCMTASAIGEAIGKDRSTAHRSLEKLIPCGLCHKERKTGRRRGYVYEYVRISDEDLYRETEKRLNDCYAKVKKAMSELALNK